MTKVCRHCGGPVNGLGVLVTNNPRTGKAEGIPVCRPMGKTDANSHLEPLDCWSLVKYRGYELGSGIRSIDLAMLIQSERFDDELSLTLEAITNDARTDQGRASALLDEG